MCGKYFKRKHKITKHSQIKDKHILVPGQRYQHSRHLLQNPKVSKKVMGFNNYTQRSTPPYYLDVDNPFTRFVRNICIPKMLEFTKKFFFPSLAAIERY